MRPSRLRHRVLVALLAVTALLSGCGDDDQAEPAPPVAESTSVPATPAPTTLVPTTVADVDLLPDGAEGLVGRWAHFDAVAYEDDVFKSLIISTGFSNLEIRDGVLWNQQRFCHAEMANDQGIDTSISDAATSAIIPVDTPVEVTLDDGRLRVVRPETPAPIGIDLADPANEVLPTDPDDPRIIDSDGDGNPGVTAHIRISDEIEGDLYIARREIFHYDVTQESEDRMVGTITDSSEQLVLGASNEIFITPAQWEQVPDSSRNPVIWQRVDETWDCERLAAERDEIFPPDPVVDW